MSRLEQELGFKARVGFEQGLKQTIEYFASSASAT
jgi:nucleoside-diphosphate-sugar epimerase